MHGVFRSLTRFGGQAVGLLGPAAGCTGCDDEVGPAYLGESLLSIRGSVEIEDGQSLFTNAPTTPHTPRYPSSSTRSRPDSDDEST